MKVYIDGFPVELLSEYNAATDLLIFADLNHLDFTLRLESDPDLVLRGAVRCFEGDRYISRPQGHKR